MTHNIAELEAILARPETDFASVKCPLCRHSHTLMRPAWFPLWAWNFFRRFA